MEKQFLLTIQIWSHSNFCPGVGLVTHSVSAAETFIQELPMIHNLPSHSDHEAYLAAPVNQPAF